MRMIMETDPYFWTQDNGAGAPVHFATTYKQLDMLHHVLRHAPECVNQRDPKGFTPLHRAAYLAQFDGYLEMFEYLLSEGADPSIESEDYDPYLDPGRKTPVALTKKDPEVHDTLVELVEKYAHVEKRPEPHVCLGDWWTLYDYGFDEVRTWPKDFVKEFPEDRLRERARREKREFKERRRVKRAEIEAEIKEQREKAVPDLTRGEEYTRGAEDIRGPEVKDASRFHGSSAFLFPGQGSQVVGMLGDDALRNFPRWRRCVKWRTRCSGTICATCA